jgi:hypothetical protein
VLGLCIALSRSKFVQPDCFGVILRNTLTMCMHEAKAALGCYLALRRKLSRPGCCQRQSSHAPQQKSLHQAPKNVKSMLK